MVIGFLKATLNRWSGFTICNTYDKLGQNIENALIVFLPMKYMLGRLTPCIYSHTRDITVYCYKEYSVFHIHKAFNENFGKILGVKNRMVL